MLHHRLSEIDYFPLGNGMLPCIVAWDHAVGRAPYGLLIAAPGRMSRREATLLWHPEHGLRRTMLTVIVDGVRHVPGIDSTTVEWDEESVVIRWSAGSARVEERLRMLVQVLRREVTVVAPDARQVAIEAALYANPLLFDSFEASGHHLVATGYTSIALYGGEPFERFITARPERDGDGTFSWRFEYLSPCGHEALSGIEAHGRPESHMPASTRRDFTRTPLAEMSRTTRQLAHATRSLRAAVAHDGRFNASLFQYEFEWGLDAAMVASAASHAGDHALAAEVLTNILTRLSNDDGMIAEASRFRGGELSELNGNGAVLDGVWRYWLVTRDDELVRSHWSRIVAVAEYPLREEFAHESGLLRTRRDFWERYPWQGVGDGFELGHQVFCTVGLASAAGLATTIGDAGRAARWSAASQRIRTAMLEHPTLSLIEDGRFVRRRLVDGRVESALIADPSWHRDEFAPYLPAGYDTVARACEPDVTEVLPIVFGLVEPTSAVARATLDAVTDLWSPAGGYTRYNVASDPDSPGPWPFATAMVAAAELMVGLDDRARRTIDWLLDVAGPGGSWLEYYGERVSPPHPPTGIIVWGWAQYILLALEAMAGVRIERDRVAIRPRMAGIKHTLCLTGHAIRLDVRGLSGVLLDGVPSGLEVVIPLPLTRDHDVEYQ